MTIIAISLVAIHLIIADANVLALYCLHRYEMMRHCWNFLPEERPKFAELAHNISQQLRIVDDGSYLVMNNDN